MKKKKINQEKLPEIPKKPGELPLTEPKGPMIKPEECPVINPEKSPAPIPEVRYLACK